MKTVLVLGGAGYVGSKVALDLLSQGFKVVIIDNLSRGHRFLISAKCHFFKVNINCKNVS